jgi:ssDNA-binding Zn-finger/Zn-ribbon topoisomerase 1
MQYSRYHSHTPTYALTAVCPRCDVPLCVRDGARGYFIGCSGYPGCRYTSEYDRALQSLGKRLHDLEDEVSVLHFSACESLPLKCSPSIPATLDIDRELKKLLLSCHPDRWQGHPVATALTQAVLELRDRIREEA